MIVRRYRSADSVALAALYVRSVRLIGGRTYSPAQVEAWASLSPSARTLDDLCGDGRVRLVAVDDADRPAAFADLTPDGHIHFLYCAPEFAGQGVASAVYEELERVARAQGIGRLYAEASEAARRFFLKQGFAIIARRDFDIAGIAIHNYAVEKFL